MVVPDKLTAGGGGGAGGVLTNIPGLMPATSAIPAVGTGAPNALTVTIGGGGAGEFGPTNPTPLNLDQIPRWRTWTHGGTAVGGGGASATNDPPYGGQPGGSGGGARIGRTPDAGGTGTTGQGNPGGPSSGGGGGAGAAGDTTAPKAGGWTWWYWCSTSINI